ncbi:hypothetical protein [Rhodopseudomonas palustris]|uniref:hypothetical protein n=1 Tax=Rhodopseudomonas palustris TaxID=1076 RepID=UPI0015FFBF8D|nr:hypothetical protein [Rhodopseudomonas palustris]
MAGADAKMKALWKQLKGCSDEQRELHYQRLAENYGEGFARTVRETFEKTLASEPPT